MIATFNTVPQTGKGISTTAIVVTLGLIVLAFVAYKNKDKIKAFFVKKPVEKPAEQPKK